MDKTDAVNIAHIYANTVRKKYDYIKIILFGSYAKGNYNDDSDIDIAVYGEGMDKNRALDLSAALNERIPSPYFLCDTLGTSRFL